MDVLPKFPRENSCHTFNKHFMWDMTPPALDDVKRENFFDSDGCYGSKNNSIFPEWRFMRYLPLSAVHDNLCGLAMFCHQGGIVGIQVEFENSRRLSGRIQGCRIYFPIQGANGEAISDVWIRKRASSAEMRIGMEPTVAVSIVLRLLNLLNAHDWFCSFAQILIDPASSGHI